MISYNFNGIHTSKQHFEETERKDFIFKKLFYFILLVLLIHKKCNKLNDTNFYLLNLNTHTDFHLNFKTLVFICMFLFHIKLYTDIYYMTHYHFSTCNNKRFII